MNPVLVVASEPVQFARDVLPILSSKCFACHGPDEQQRKAELRLDREEDAKAERGGGVAITAGDVARSSIIDRITSDDPDVVMPPPSANHQVTPEQVATLKRWIAEGASWQTHWSFRPIVSPGGTIDQWIKREGSLAPQAVPQVLLRRLSLDLIGLPPTPEEADAFAENLSDDAYEAAVDRLLNSPQFGEHWARMWLDLARYADTKGYEKDLGRTMWPYRDWVIRAFNQDMPLDQFTREQLAGDLLPSPTQDQLIATAFHRNTMSNDEGGTDDEEFRSIAVKDRIDTTIQVWMGLTMGCAKCHTHKYDPISQQAYYQFYALFNQTEDADRPDDEPRMTMSSDAEKDEQQRREAAVATAADALESAISQWTASSESGWNQNAVAKATSQNQAMLTAESDRAILASGTASETDTYTVELSLDPGRHTALRIEAIPTKLSNGQSGVGRNPSDPNFVISELIVEQLEGESPRRIGLLNPRADFSQGGWPVASAIDGKLDTGWAISPQQKQRHTAIFDFDVPLEVKVKTTLRVTLTQNYGNRLVLAKFRLSTAHADPKSLEVHTENDAIRELRKQWEQARKSLQDYVAGFVKLPVMRELPENKRRTTKIHVRGNFLEPGATVEPDVITSLVKRTDNLPLNRLGAAQWLMCDDNPLTARVWANRIWARLFGLGIVETEEDFGALGTPPTHPELLDLLASDLRDHGWSLKRLIKSIVMSETYKQDSPLSATAREQDPRNQQVKRGSRYRLSAEVIRDQALAVSGLLSYKAGGPSVMPPQPAGLWRSTYNGQNWVDAQGEDRYRRGIYTFLKRTTPYPMLTTFDASSGEVCQVRRIRTNTPLQALITLNDPVFIEAAAALAEQMLRHGETTEQQAAYGLRRALVRPVTTAEVTPLVKLQQDTESVFREFPERAKALIDSVQSIESRLPKATSSASPTDAATRAAWIVTANAILNLDEFLTRH